MAPLWPGMGAGASGTARGQAYVRSVLAQGEGLRRYKPTESTTFRDAILAAREASRGSLSHYFHGRLPTSKSPGVAKGKPCLFHVRFYPTRGRCGDLSVQSR